MNTLPKPSKATLCIGSGSDRKGVSSPPNLLAFTKEHETKPAFRKGKLCKENCDRQSGQSSQRIDAGWDASPTPKLVRMSSGRYCLIRDLGLVKGGKGLRHHEVVLELARRGLVRFAMSRLRTARTDCATVHEPETAKKNAYSVFERSVERFAV